MKKLFFITLFLGIIMINAQEQKKDQEYIRRFAQIAIQEMKLYNIPASITLGQGLLETANGQSELAKNANNHFGIKCKETWKGETYRYTDDSYMECFRKYSSADESYRDHSIFLTTRKHYSNLFTLSNKDYKGWAYGLKKAGYATNPKYPQILIGKIERYKLYEFDNLNQEQILAKLDELYPETKYITSINQDKKEIYTKEISKNEPETEGLTEKNNYIQFDNQQNSNNEPEIKIESKLISKKIEPIIKENSKSKIEIKKPKNIQARIKYHSNKDLKYIVLEKNETLKHISSWYGIPLPELKNFNDIFEDTHLKENQFVFLEYKRSKGEEKEYVVKQGDSIYDISQKLGIKLDELYRKNNLEKGIEPNIGDILYLKRRK